MHYLYVDNIRGFENTYIPIMDVNFLVGENSTGKTTILTLINLLASPRFWLSQTFNTDEVELGSFQQIISINSQDNSQFRIGVIECPDTQDEKPEVNAFLITFVEDDGLPIISGYNFISEKNEVRVVFSKKGIEYKVIPLAEGSSKSIMQIFRRWATQKSQDEKDYERIDGKDIPFARNTSLPFITNFLKDKSAEARTRGEIPLPSFASDLTWIAPIRSKPKRTYDEYKLSFTPEGDHTPYLIRRLVGRKGRAATRFLSFIEKTGKESGLFDSIKVKTFGKGSDSPFAVDVIIGGKELRIVNTGYGISQSLPVIVELIAREKGTWYAIQQPEVHLHPRAQAALGDLFFQLALEEDKRFLIETHSDFIIDRYRLNHRKNKSTNLHSQVLFFERTQTGNRVHTIGINDNGEYSEDQPQAFRDFFVREQLSLLGL